MIKATATRALVTMLANSDDGLDSDDSGDEGNGDDENGKVDDGRIGTGSMAQHGEGHPWHWQHGAAWCGMAQHGEGHSWQHGEGHP